MSLQNLTQLFLKCEHVKVEKVRRKGGERKDEEGEGWKVGRKEDREGGRDLKL